MRKERREKEKGVKGERVKEVIGGKSVRVVEKMGMGKERAK